MSIKSIKFLLIIFFAVCFHSYGQITIGTKSPPNNGALLHLKQNDNSGENANSGLLLPRVNLKTKDQLYPMFNPGDPLYTESEKILHTGLTVYNLTNDPAADLCPGPYYWSSSIWERLWEPCISPVSIICSDVYATGYMNIDMSTTTPIVQIPYTLSSGSSFSLPATIIGAHENITATIEAQTLNSQTGFIDVKFSGIPTTMMDKVPFSINIAGSTCSIYLSVMIPPSACPDGLVTRAFVFQQGTKWYVLTPDGNYNGNRVAQTIECNTEEEALRHPEALQYCSNKIDSRCISLFDRTGTQVGVWLNMTSSSSAWLNGITQATGGCIEWLIFYEGARIREYPSNKNVGAVNVINGRGYFGYTSQTATMTTKQLR